MGAEELLAALRHEGEKKASAIREEAEAEAARLKAEAAGRLEELRKRHAQEQAAAGEAEACAILAEAERSVRRIRLSATERLAQRLGKLALALLPTLRGAKGVELLNRLAAELPPREWEKLKVNPADLEQAKALFPSAFIEGDPEVCGGLVAWAKGGELLVVNTLEKRLERAWPELLPLLLKEVESGG